MPLCFSNFWFYFLVSYEKKKKPNAYLFLSVHCLMWLLFSLRWPGRFTATSIAEDVLWRGGNSRWRSWGRAESVEVVAGGSLSLYQMVPADRWMKRRKCFLSEKPLAHHAESLPLIVDHRFCSMIDNICTRFCSKYRLLVVPSSAITCIFN